MPAPQPAPPLAALASLSPLPAWLRREALTRALSICAPYALALSSLAALLAFALRSPLPLFALCALPVALAARYHRALRDPLALTLTLDARLRARAVLVTAAEHALRALPASPVTTRVHADARALLSRARSRDAVPLPPRATALAYALALALAPLFLLRAPRHTLAVAPTAPTRSPSAAPPDRLAARAAERAADALGRLAARDPAREPAAREAMREALALAALEAAPAPHAARLELADALEQHTRALDQWLRDPSRRASVDAALQALAREPAAEQLAQALARGDARALDRAARALADRQEARSRAAALAALARAEEAARNAGATDVAEALAETRLLAQRRAQANALARALGEALDRRDPALAARLTDSLTRQGEDDLAVQRALEEAMRAFDQTLTEAERRAVADALARFAAEQPAARSTDTPRAQTPEQAREAMRALLEAARRGELSRTPAGRAAEQSGEARSAATQLRLRIQRGPASESASGAGTGSGPPGDGQDPSGGQGAAGRGGGGHVASSPGGATRELAARPFTAPVRAARDPRAAPMIISDPRENPDGTRATQLAPEAQLRAAAPDALRGLDRSPVPRAYQAQVRAYFEH